MMRIERTIYLDKVIESRHNGMIKIITGVRRSGKSFLLFDLFADWLEAEGVSSDHIIKIDLENRRNKSLRNPDNLLEFIDSKMIDKEMYYILIDEIQLVDEFEDVLNSYLKIKNADVYVTGSNARFLSKDVITTFRGRGEEIKVYPLNFREFMSATDKSTELAFEEFMTYGGLPQVLEYKSEERKAEYLKALFAETYITDIKERYNVKHDEELEILLDIISSNIGCLTNPSKLANTFQSEKKVKLSDKTIKNYLDYICDSFLVEKSQRYDIKGKKYIDTPYKYYFVDLGLRNARLNFRQLEKTHMMENIIYNELRVRGFNVDVGIVPLVIRDERGNQKRISYEVDFVANKGNQRYYIQSAYRLDSDEKVAQEQNSLRNVDDSFKKIVIVGNPILVERDNNGITTMSVYDFLLKENSLEL
ncbi:MAG: ATP-binding protein [Bacteroidales bacterium]|nr:ATP-binding protein [Bacteroidales bacterium]MBD5342895.1 ATP-binding protein [Bacteroides sp.]MBD5373681.1 ATP-binding protein [Bacteroides sp.]